MTVGSGLPPLGRYRVRVYVTTRRWKMPGPDGKPVETGVLNPADKAVLRVLHQLGFKEVEEVLQGIYIDIVLDAQSAKIARERVAGLAKTGRFHNPIMQDVRVEEEEKVEKIPEAAVEEPTHVAAQRMREWS